MTVLVYKSLADLSETLQEYIRISDVVELDVCKNAYEIISRISNYLILKEELESGTDNVVALATYSDEEYWEDVDKVEYYIQLLRGNNYVWKNRNETYER